MPKNSAFSGVKDVTPLTYDNGRFERRSDRLVAEEPLEIRIGTGNAEKRRRISVAVTMRTPGADEDLGCGFLFSEGIISSKEQILSARVLEENILTVDLHADLTIDEERLKRHSYTTSSCGVCGKASLDAVQTVACFFPLSGHPRVAPEVLCALPDTMRAAQEAFEKTGGIHAAALFDTAGRLLILREDVGRHNAVDKVLGAALRAGMPFPLKDCLMMVSGRAGFELVQKSAMAGIPLLAAVGAPTSLSVELAVESGMTLVGFLRGRRFNVYSCPERIIGADI